MLKCIVRINYLKSRKKELETDLKEVIKELKELSDN